MVWYISLYQMMLPYCCSGGQQALISSTLLDAEEGPRITGRFGQGRWGRCGEHMRSLGTDLAFSPADAVYNVLLLPL